MSAESVITVERSGHVATVWLDRPEKRNAMAPSFWEQLPVVMAEVGEDPDVRVVVLAARGLAFTVGLDLMAFGPDLASGNLGGGGSSPAARASHTRAQIHRMQGSISAVADCPKPVIAVIHGYCIGAGVDLITACDLRIAAADASFSVRETRLAIVADVGTLQRLPRIVRPGRVAEMVYTGRDVSAAEAREFGLVDHVHPDQESALQAARDTATQIAENSPLAVQGAKAVMRASDGKTVAESLEYVALWNAAMLQSNDLFEAVQAFAQKRPPEYTGE